MTTEVTGGPLFSSVVKEHTQHAILSLADGIQLCAAALIGLAALQAVARALAIFFRRGAAAAATEEVRIRLGRWLVLALEFQVGEAREIVIVTPHSRKEAEPFLDVLRRVFLPSSVLVVTNEGPPLAKLSKLAPLVEGKSAIGGKATAYVCTQGSCKLPATSPSVFEKQLRKG